MKKNTGLSIGTIGGFLALAVLLASIYTKINNESVKYFVDTLIRSFILMFLFLYNIQLSIYRNSLPEHDFKNKKYKAAAIMSIFMWILCTGSAVGEKLLFQETINYGRILLLSFLFSILSVGIMTLLSRYLRFKPQKKDGFL